MIAETDRSPSKKSGPRIFEADRGLNMPTYISDKVGKPRKPHNCHICAEVINPGEQCQIYKCVEDLQGFYRLYFHLECWAYTADWKDFDWENHLPGDTSRKEVLELTRIKNAAVQVLIPGRRKVYVASSWRNTAQPGVVTAIRKMGHEVYDFRNPVEGNTGFHWSEVDGGWQKWDAKRYVKALDHPIAEAEFRSDFEAMQWADTFVLVQPCGRSAHLEMGWAVGAGKATIMLLGPDIEPELMVKMCDHICVGLDSVLELFDVFEG